MAAVRVRLLMLAGVVVLVAVGGGLAIAAATSSDGGDTSAVPHGTYCDSTRRALEYVGSDRARQIALLDRVVARAPADVAPTVRSVRAAPPSSSRYTAAHNVWSYYNNTHCCDCHLAYPPPEIRAFTPEQRARVEAGGLP
jgi:hypothetical protein